MKIRIFEEKNYGSISIFQDNINSWLKNDYEIKQFLQSINERGYLIYTFLYYDKKELRKEKLHKINKT